MASAIVNFAQSVASMQHNPQGKQVDENIQDVHRTPAKALFHTTLSCVKWSPPAVPHYTPTNDNQDSHNPIG